MNDIIFAGKNPFFKEILEYTLTLPEIRISGVLYNPKQDSGIKRLLEEHSIKGYSLEMLANPGEFTSLFNNVQINWLINFNAIVIVQAEILEVVEDGSLNMHPGLLPSYAGLHTHQWAIRNGENEFGSTLHWMEPRVDSGDIVFQQKFPLNGNETGLTLYLKCLRAGKQMIEKALDLINDDKSLPRIPQDLNKRKVYLNRDAQDGTINWDLDAEEILRFFQAADYGFFESPTYKPHTFYKEHKVFLEKAKSGNVTNSKPGTILSKDQDQIEIACGNKKSIIAKVKNAKEIKLKVGKILNSIKTVIH